MRKTGMIVVAMIAMLCMPAALAGDKSDMAGRIEVWEKLYNSGKFDALAEQYTEDGTRMPYQAPSLNGREAIVAMNRESAKQGARKIDLELLGSESRGKMAWAHGTYHLMAADGSSIQNGKWMNVSKKVGKEWLIVADIWNTDAP